MSELFPNTRKILVTGAGALLGQGIIRSLRHSKLSLEIVAAAPSPLSAGLYWADRGCQIPMAAAPDYLDRIKQVLAAERPQLLMVGTNEELNVFAACRDELTAEFGTIVLVSAPEVLAITTDKYRTYRFLDDAGFNPPRSALPEDKTRLIESVGFPLIVKPRVGGRSSGVCLVNNRIELDRALATGSNLLVQEHVGSAQEEYTAGTIHFEGQDVASIVMRRDLRDGNTYRAYADAFPELNRQMVAMARALKAFGPANFQFRLDSEGRARVFEINGRFSGTTPLRALVGFPEVEMCVRHLLDGESVRQPAVERNTILRYWSEVVVSDRDIDCVM